MFLVVQLKLSTRKYLCNMLPRIKLVCRSPVFLYFFMTYHWIFTRVHPRFSVGCKLSNLCLFLCNVLSVIVCTQLCLFSPLYCLSFKFNLRLLVKLLDSSNFLMTKRYTSSNYSMTTGVHSNIYTVPIETRSYRI